MESVPGQFYLQKLYSTKIKIMASKILSAILLLVLLATDINAQVDTSSSVIKTGNQLLIIKNGKTIGVINLLAVDSTKKKDSQIATIVNPDGNRSILTNYTNMITMLYPNGANYLAITNSHISIMVNSNGTHSTVINNGNTLTVVNPDGTHSTLFKNGNTSTMVNPNGTHSTVINNGSTSIVVNPDGTHSVIFNQ